MIAALGLLLGIIAGLVFAPDVPLSLQNYLPIAVVAALDAVFGGLRAYLDGIFDDKVFVVSFVSNVVIAATIVYHGDQLGVGGQLSTGVIVVRPEDWTAGLSRTSTPSGMPPPPRSRATSSVSRIWTSPRRSPNASRSTMWTGASTACTVAPVAEVEGTASSPTNVAR